MEEARFVVPGDLLTTNPAVLGGCGVYTLSGKTEMRASLLGMLVVETLQDGVQRYNVVPEQGTVSAGITVGDKCICRVTRIATNQCLVDVLSVNDGRPLSTPFPKGVVRREDVRLANVDALLMHDCFRPGDLIRAAVLSLGDSKQYYLSSADSDLGVIRATSVAGNPLTPVSWFEMKDQVTGKQELRKVAKPQ
jgi:exosome complex component CSL4